MIKFKQFLKIIVILNREVEKHRFLGKRYRVL